MYYYPYRVYDLIKGHYSSDVKYFGMYVNKLKRQKRGGYKRK